VCCFDGYREERERAERERRQREAQDAAARRRREQEAAEQRIREQEAADRRNKIKKIVKWVIISGIIIAVIYFCKNYENPKPSTTTSTSTSSSTQTQQPPSTPTEIFTDKFVHPNGLNVRTRPDANSPIRFTLSQNTIVQVSDRDRSGFWVKIKHNGREGFVNQTYLRDFRITEILVGDRLEGNWRTSPGNTLHGRSIRYLGIQIRFSTLNNYSGNTKLMIRIIDPQGEIFRSSSNSPPALSTSNGLFYYTFDETINAVNNSPIYIGGWGSSSGGAYYTGTWRVEIWHTIPNNQSNTNSLIASRSFTFN